MPTVSIPSASKSKSHLRWKKHQQRPTPICMGKDFLMMKRKLCTSLSNGNTFKFFHKAGLATVTVKIKHSMDICPTLSDSESLSSSSAIYVADSITIVPMERDGIRKEVVDDSYDIMAGIEIPMVLEKMLEAHDSEANAQGIETNDEMSDNFSCISVEQHQDKISMAGQDMSDQSTDTTFIFTSGGALKRNKLNSGMGNQLGVSLCQPYIKDHNKMGHKKDKLRRTAGKSNGRVGKITASLDRKIFCPSKCARQPIILDLAFDRDLFQAFKRRKRLLGYAVGS